ncbi:MAG: ribosome-associated translation inhibitor RaiA [Bacteriovoracaceae bacterium]|nr:ribosome-associated translation inhibitor RaiA [Bacteriovoracaceae bacterium]
MKVQIFFRNAKRSESTDEKVYQKTESFAKFFMKHPQVKWVCEKDGNDYHVEVYVHDQGKDYHAKTTGENMYKCFDYVADKMERQLQKHHGKIKNKIHKKWQDVDFDQRPLHKKYAA